MCKVSEKRKIFAKFSSENPRGVFSNTLKEKILELTLEMGGSTQPLTEISTRSISWGVKTAGA